MRFAEAQVHANSGTGSQFENINCSLENFPSEFGKRVQALMQQFRATWTRDGGDPYFRIEVTGLRVYTVGDGDGE